MNVNQERIIKVSNSIKNFGLDNILLLEERVDPQFDYIQRLKMKVGKGYATLYSLIVSLVSYKLAMKGEEWWQCFSNYLSDKEIPKNVDEAIKNVIDFMKDCKGSIIGQKFKLKRIEKISKSKELLNAIVNNPEIVLEKPEEIMKKIASSLGTEEWKKTITFSIKMAYYAVKNKGEIKPLLINIPMPIDIRISCLTYTSGIVESESFKEILKNPKTAIKAWDMVSELSEVPQIHLDSLLWVIGWAPRELEISEARKKVIEFLSKYYDSNKINQLIKELFYRECK
ncbi:N-glycosylase/DNA lyase [Caldisphaera sp.]|uniref:N-glycosylase/DNA lyase n=1 Tax=Caldisphaera sp. TaxID=2060322 RepID=UPI0025C056D9|nr:N-glycosylase/DNA lyase [Caldisphaera sp.]